MATKIMIITIMINTMINDNDKDKKSSQEKYRTYNSGRFCCGITLLRND